MNIPGLHKDNVFVQKIQDETTRSENLNLNVLRLDKIHPVISGNKFFKLKYYLQDAIASGAQNIATFGGAFSNHIIATAYACNALNISCTGFIRGEEPEHYSQTLLDAMALKMQLRFISRADYSNKQDIISKNTSLFFIPEGGYGFPGVKGAKEIFSLVPKPETYDCIVCATGTGTMLSGLINASLPKQQCIGMSVMKKNTSLEGEVRNFAENDRFVLLHDYHFGGYAKYNEGLISFMNNKWKMNQLPLDFVYTAKALFGLYDLAKKSFFNPGTSILFIHSGGLQGNRSLNNKLEY